MSTLLIRNATVVVTMDAQRREIADGGLWVRDGFIKQVGPILTFVSRRAN